MKSIYSAPATLAAVALLALTVPAAALSEMRDMSRKGHHEAHGQMMDKRGHGEANGQDRGHMDQMADGMGMCMAHAEEMGLTDDQMAKMKPMHSEMQKLQARFKADLKIAEIELGDIMEVKDFDLEKATAAAKNISAIRAAHHLEMLKSMKEMGTMLTDDQFKKMKKMMPMQMGEKRPAKKAMKK